MSVVVTHIARPHKAVLATSLAARGVKGLIIEACVRDVVGENRQPRPSPQCFKLVSHSILIEASDRVAPHVRDFLM